MIAFVMMYRIWFQIGILVALVGALWWGVHAYNFHEQQIGYDRAAAEYQVKLTAAIKEKQDTEDKWRKQLETANDNYAKRQAKLTATIATASAANAGLQHALDNIRSSVSSDPPDTLAHRITTLSTVLGDCSTAYQGLAITCDRIANDEQRILDSWPH